MSILQQAIQVKCNKVVNLCMRRRICLKCFAKTNVNHRKQTGSSCIMLHHLKLTRDITLGVVSST